MKLPGPNFGRTEVMITIKRVYAPPAPGDGYRVLVDRLWPRGLKREDAAIDAWLKDLAPSTELRTWYGHEPSRWAEFQRRYRGEMLAPEVGPSLGELRTRAHAGTVTLLFAARSEHENNAQALRTVLQDAV